MAVLWALMMSGWSVAAEPEPPRRHALLIGSNDGMASEQPLLFATRDATRMADTLLRVGDVRPENLLLLRNPDRSQVLRAFDVLEQRVRHADSSVVVVYYSGHASAGALHIGGQALRFEDLEERLAKLDSQVELLIVDACRSGSLTRVKGVVPAEPFELDLTDRLDTEGLAVLTSSSPGEDAQESDHLQGGVFTHHLVTGLLGAADSSGDGRVTITEAFRYSYDQTVRSTSVAPVLQHPAYRMQLSGQRDLVVSSPDTADEARLRLDSPGTWLILGEGGEELVAEVEIRDDTLLALGSGSYLLRQRREGSVYEGRVKLARGEISHVDESELERVPSGESIRKGYDPGRSSAGVLFVGGGAEGVYGIGEGLGGAGRAGLRVDLATLSVGLRGLARIQGGREGSFRAQQVEAGLEGELLRLERLGRGWWGGLGVRGGAGFVRQRFITRGQAPPRMGLVAHGGSVLRLERALGSRALIGLDAGMDGIALRGETGSYRAIVRPTLHLEVGHYVW